MNRFSFLVFLFFIWGCRNITPEEKGTFKIDWKKDGIKIENTYAQGFSIDKFKNYYRITVSDPQSKTIYGKYVLYREEDEKPVLSEGETGILYPIKTIASVSTTHLPFIKLLDEKNSLVGYAGQKFVIDPEFVSFFKEKNTIELGSDNQLNHEKVIELNPSTLMVYPFENLNFKKMEDAGIPVFYNTEYLELHPLGKAEWIKVFGLLYGETKYKKSIETYSAIEERYLFIKSMADTINIRPEVFTGTIQSGTWYVPGGKSFQAVFLKDAGSKYIWENDQQNNSLALSPEIVIEKCLDAHFWVLVASCGPQFSLEELKNENDIYDDFSAFKNRNVLFCNSNLSDYFGMGVAEPDKILSDLVYYFHPEILKNYTPQYFQKLK
jgi:iron complex transport system substrate-binding protein